ncbi:MAG: hypothetical protein U9Q92_04270 [archaeon]|nr:hypothetical protein [archaeon]
MEEAYEDLRLVVEKNLNGSDAVHAHQLYGDAVFIECGVHEPENFCYDHHTMGESKWQLTSAGMIYQELMQRRKMPHVTVMNHVRHLDNIVSLYLLEYRGLVGNPETGEIVWAAERMDRIGPLAASSVPQMTLSVLETAQNIIPFKEWTVDDKELEKYAISAIESLRGMVTAPIKTAQYKTLYESDDGKFIIVKSDDPIGNTLYDKGYDAYAAWDGESKWTLARASNYVPFDIPSALDKLNALEKCGEGKEWGGRSDIAGSPRGIGTKLDYEEITGVLKGRYS